MRIPLETAKTYRDYGLSVLPAKRKEKCPALKSWKAYQERRPTEAEVNAWFSNAHEAVCIVTGKASENLEIIDFDNGGELFDSWVNLVGDRSKPLLDQLVIEQTPSGGWHVIYRCDAEVSGNMKLAQGQRNGKLTTLIETRGAGGLFLCAPTPKYELLQGDFTVIPTLTENQRDILLSSARQLNEHWVSADPEPVQKTPSSGLLPGEDFNQRGDIKALLERHGWKYLYSKNDNDYYRRPGKDHGSCSASLKDRTFFVFSSNAAPFEPWKSYSPFAVYTLLECYGEYSVAAGELASKGYGEPLPEPDNSDVDISGIITPAKDIVVPGPLSLRQMLVKYPNLRDPIIHGLLREGETLNVIAPTKTGKSWLVIDLALSVSTGLPWLGLPCEPGNVLILDNELHGETSANRIPRVADARNIGLGLVYDKLFVDNLRGRLMDILAMQNYFQRFKPKQFRLIILDALYRFLPAGTDENDNGAMANIYNRIDRYADQLQCSFVLIHHTSKGNQALKAVTDVGAGAGTQARATDTHFILRHHEEPGVVAVEAEVRSWPPLAPYCLHWNFPVWTPDHELDPSRLLGMRREHDGAARKDMEPGEFVMTFFHENPISKARAYELAALDGLSQRRIGQLLQLAQEAELLYRWPMPNNTIGFATAAPTKGELLRMTVIEETEKNPDVGNDELARKFGVTERRIRQIRTEISC